MDSNIVTKLKEYKELLDSGIITDDEFAELKKNLLAGEMQSSTPDPVQQPAQKAAPSQPQPQQVVQNQATAHTQSRVAEEFKKAQAEGFLTTETTSASTAGLSGSDRWQSATLDAFRNIFNFKGRLNKQDFWWAILSIVIFDVVSAVLLIIPIIGWLVFIIWSIVGGFMLLSMIIRRLHDTGRPWPWILLMMTGIGTILIIIWALEDGQPVENQWGQPVA